MARWSKIARAAACRSLTPSCLRSLARTSSRIRCESGGSSRHDAPSRQVLAFCCRLHEKEGVVQLAMPHFDRRTVRRAGGAIQGGLHVHGQRCRRLHLLQGTWDYPACAWAEPDGDRAAGEPCSLACK